MELSLADFNQRYRHTFIRWKSKEGLVPVYVAQVAGTANGKGIIGFERIKEEAFTLIYPDCLEQLDLSQPMPGFFNLNEFAIYFFRYPDRQWHRGLSNTNTEFFNPLKILTRDIHFYKPSLSNGTANALFNRKFITDISEVINKLTNSHCSIALSPKLMISLSPIKEGRFLLWWGCTPVGLWSDKDEKFHIKDLTFDQELIDEFKKLNITSQWMKF